VTPSQERVEGILEKRSQLLIISLLRSQPHELRVLTHYPQPIKHQDTYLKRPAQTIVPMRLESTCVASQRLYRVAVLEVECSGRNSTVHALALQV